jgi:hypothetical protein
MKTATIDYADFEVLIGASLGTIALMEEVSAKASGKEKEQADKVVSEVRATVERVVMNAVVGHRQQSFQDKLSEMIANAKAKQGNEKAS